MNTLFATEAAVVIVQLVVHRSYDCTILLKGLTITERSTGMKRDNLTRRTFLATASAGTVAAVASKGHSAFRNRTADARVHEKLYRFNFNDFLGQFMILASRIDEKHNESIQIMEAIESGKACKEDRIAEKVLDQVMGGSPMPKPLPPDGFPETA